MILAEGIGIGLLHCPGSALPFGLFQRGTRRPLLLDPLPFGLLSDEPPHPFVLGPLAFGPLGPFLQEALGLLLFGPLPSGLRYLRILLSSVSRGMRIVDYMVLAKWFIAFRTAGMAASHQVIDYLR